MTFGRPCTIPESYVKLEMPLQDMQVLSSTPKSESYPQLDGWFFTAAMLVGPPPPPFSSTCKYADPYAVNCTS